MPTNSRRALYAALALASTVGCAGRHAPVAAPAAAPAAVVELDPVRIEATPDGAGGHRFESVDARGLFEQALAAVRGGDCAAGVALYDRVADDFADTDWASPALYNAGLCLMDAGEHAASVARFERLLEEHGHSRDVRHASFQLAGLYVELERWGPGIEVASRLLASDDLGTDERMEAMARRAQSLFGAGRTEEAHRQADEALRYYRTRPEEGRVRDTFFAAAANFVLAETLRARAEAIDVPNADIAAQRAVLERRAGLMLDAQRAYFDTMRHTEAFWSAAAGYRIGAMYDRFWEALMEAPVPEPESELSRQHPEIWEEEYLTTLARLVKPLLRHSIRYWEMTLQMVERTGVRTGWTARIRQDLERARERLRDAPDGPSALEEAARERYQARQVALAARAPGAPSVAREGGAEVAPSPPSGPASGGPSEDPVTR